MGLFQPFLRFWGKIYPVYAWYARGFSFQPFLRFWRNTVARERLSSSRVLLVSTLLEILVKPR